MDSELHYFISPNGDLLPRWSQAFPQALAIRYNEVAAVKFVPDLVWLKLDEGISMQEQVNTVREGLGPSIPPVRLIVMSNLPDDDEALEAFRLEARGYCNSHASPDLLKQIAQVVLKDGMWLGASLMNKLNNPL
jgi:DNA-binding NarL/FixJ family response regulator